MRYAEELVDVKELTFPKTDVRKGELQMARTLVEQLADTWDPGQYTDEYRANLMKIIRAKLKGKEAHLAETPQPQQAEVVDLMERLRQSLQQTGGGRARSGTSTNRSTSRGTKRASPSSGKGRSAAGSGTRAKSRRRRAA